MRGDTQESMHNTTSDYWKVSAMQVPANNRKDDSYIRSRGVEKSVIFLLIGIGALLFFLATVVGMGSVSSGSRDSEAAPAIRTANEGSAEIGVAPIE